MAAISLYAQFLESFISVHGNGESVEDDWVVFRPLLPMEGPPLIKIKTLKDRGNDFFKQNLFESAGGCYDMACRLLCITLESMDDNDIESVLELAISLNLNLAACANKLYEYEAAKNFCSLVLSSFPKNAKALFRRAVAFMKTNMLSEAQTDLEAASMLEPKNKDILREMNVVKNLRAINTNGKRSINDHLLFEVVRESKRPIPIVGNIRDNSVEDDCDSSCASCVSPLSDSIIKDTCNFDDGLAINFQDKFSPNMDLDHNHKDYQEGTDIKLYQFSKKGGGNSVLRIDAGTYKKLLDGKEVSFFKKSHVSTMKIRILQSPCNESDTTFVNPRKKKRRSRRKTKRNGWSTEETQPVVNKTDISSSSSVDTSMPLVCEPNSEEVFLSPSLENVNLSTLSNSPDIDPYQFQPFLFTSSKSRARKIFIAKRQLSSNQSQGDESPGHSVYTFSGKSPRPRDVSVSCCRYSPKAQMIKKRKELSSEVSYSSNPPKKAFVLNSPSPTLISCTNNVVVASDLESQMCIV